MAAQLGNSFWKARTTHGREKIFSSDECLWVACCEYFQWVEDSPLIEMRPFAYQGVVVQEPVPKMRAMTLMGLCVFLDISDQTWRDYREYDDFIGVIKRAENIIYEQKFTGAAADLLNANIISRELGLSEKNEHTGPNGGPIQTITKNMTPQEAAAAYADTLNSNKS